MSLGEVIPQKHLLEEKNNAALTTAVESMKSDGEFSQLRLRLKPVSEPNSIHRYAQLEFTSVGAELCLSKGTVEAIGFICCKWGRAAETHVLL